MPNMSYCMFENTAKAISQCLTTLEEVYTKNNLKEFYQNLSSDYERRGFKKTLENGLLLTEFFDTFEEELKEL